MQCRSAVPQQYARLHWSFVVLWSDVWKILHKSTMLCACEVLYTRADLYAVWTTSLFWTSLITTGTHMSTQTHISTSCKQASCKQALRLLVYRWMYHRQCNPDLQLPSRPKSSATAPRLVLSSHPTEGRTLSWPEWLVTYRGEIPMNGHPSQYWPGLTYSNCWCD